ncbi:MAG: LysM peptidoglycan-binding domain-containing protein [Sphingobacteriales bacterium]|nr:LysM peptidoglycan-binding domain-containing protein [Sphingobacteriales bacterium]
MKLKFTILFTIGIVLTTLSAKAQKPDTAAIVAYIKLYKDIAIEEMNRIGIPASITLAQGIHESGWGTSYLSKNTNNHFGIKCKKEWTGKTFKYTDDAPNECFRVYDKVEDSYKDHSDFLKSRPWYASLFLLDKTDYKGWAYGLKKAGYATNPKYPEILIKLIDDFQLAAFDKGQIPSYISPLQKTIVVEKDDDEEYNVTDSMQIEVQKTVIQEKKTEVYIPVNTVSATTPQAPPVATKKINKSIFKVNDCKAVKIYTSKGETLDLIGNVLNVEKEDLLAFNDIADDSNIKDGQTIFIQQKKKSNKEGSYKVKAEDNMWSISQKKGIRLATLLKMNKLESGEEPEVKQTLVLKGKAKEKPVVRSNIKIEIPKERTNIEIDKPKESLPISSPTKKIIYDTIVRARDTIYPTIKEETKLSVDSNKMLGWESETKLLEKPNVAPFPVKDSVVKIVPPTIIPPTPDNPGRSISVYERGLETPTVYPKVIDYNSLPKSTTGTHTVVKGDTMYNLSKRYNISIAQIVEWNNLSDQSVKLGQVLKIQP